MSNLRKTDPNPLTGVKGKCNVIKIASHLAYGLVACVGHIEESLLNNFITSSKFLVVSLKKIQYVT